jgi:hypothetical protein
MAKAKPKPNLRAMGGKGALSAVLGSALPLAAAAGAAARATKRRVVPGAKAKRKGGGK